MYRPKKELTKADFSGIDTYTYPEDWNYLVNEYLADATSKHKIKLVPWWREAQVSDLQQALEMIYFSTGTLYLASIERKLRAIHGCRFYLVAQKASEVDQARLPQNTYLINPSIAIDPLYYVEVVDWFSLGGANVLPQYTSEFENLSKLNEETGIWWVGGRRDGYSYWNY